MSSMQAFSTLEVTLVSFNLFTTDLTNFYILSYAFPISYFFIHGVYHTEETVIFVVVSL
jgi:hypothetical protein